jgi:hypothetical protein
VNYILDSILPQEYYLGKGKKRRNILWKRYIMAQRTLLKYLYGDPVRDIMIMAWGFIAPVVWIWQKNGV